MSLSDDNLPPLPEPAYFVAEEAARHGMHPCYLKEQTLRQHAKEGVYCNGYTADQMRAYAKAAIAAERQRCVEIVATLYVPGHWSAGGVLNALSKITGSPWREVAPGEESSVLQWDDSEEKVND